MAISQGEKIGGRQWVRVFGPNLCPGNADRAARNKATLANPVFIKACEAMNIPATKRQASKWNNGKGKAFRAK